MKLEIIIFILAFLNKGNFLVISPEKLYIKPGGSGVITLDTTVSCQLIVDISFKTYDKVVPQTRVFGLKRQYRFKVKTDALAGYSTVCSLRCGEEEGSFELNIVEAFTAVGDPHFMQLVKDMRTGNSEYICYDISGRAGSYIYIAKYSDPDIKVYGRLLNDFYMHEILVFIESHIIIVNYSKFSFNRKRYLWPLALKKVKVPKIALRTNGNKLTIAYLSKKPIIISIFRNIRLDVRLRHLDVTLNSMERLSGGLLRDSQIKKYEFYPPVQEDSTTGTIMIDNRFYRADRTIRNNQTCWLLNASDVVNVKQFMLYKL
ncbi:unnamed protein product [Dimorphilus gyrociliatus]|uniref:Uncharacterized protein n=1 Tax=Dimorphilus gyrociliatus TaxID=2664684 RepID=A0A7I8VLG6_9ANNE|nr:unnamed protein product [Dimorphilus gyrociliatus]